MAPASCAMQVVVATKLRRGLATPAVSAGEDVYPTDLLSSRPELIKQTT